MRVLQNSADPIIQDRTDPWDEPAPIPSTPGDSAVNVLNYGAVGDGEHDDTDALQEAAAATRKCIYFPPPPVAYCVTDTITFHNKAISGFPTRDANGSRVVMWDSGWKPAFRMTGSTASMSYMSIAAGLPPAFPTTYSPSHCLQVGDGIEWVADGNISHNWFTGYATTALEMNLCQGFLVDGNVFDWALGSNVALYGAPNLVFTGNRVFLAGDTGILIAPPPGELDACQNYDITIAGNFIDEAAGANSFHHPGYASMERKNAGIYVSDCNGLRITGNHIAHNYTGICLTAHPTEPGVQAKDVSVSANTFTGQLLDDVLLDNVSRITLANNNHSPWGYGDPDGVETELDWCTCVTAVDACDRISVIGGSMVGDAKRIQGVQLSAETTNSYVDGVVWEDLSGGPVVDNGSNTTGTLIPAP